MKKIFIVIFLLTSQFVFAQKNAINPFFKNKKFSHADTLRGMLSPERACFDVTFYHLNITIDTLTKSISGSNRVVFKATKTFNKMQFDLFKNMSIEKILFHDTPLSKDAIVREGNAFFVTLPQKIKKGQIDELTIFYKGSPVAAVNPPWDGGFVWRQSQSGKTWLGVACEHTGASLWYPLKDHLSDEPDSVRLDVTVPKGLMAVCNGRLKNVVELAKTIRYEWFVSYNINSYNVTLNVGDYVHFHDTFRTSDRDTLSLDYYVLPENLEKAKTHFRQVKPMLSAYEYYFGKYPFWRDGYKLVETPYLGMEHQSAIAYGNQYMRGYLGGMIPADMNWDYIIIHESGHEYFGNAISCRDHADMFLHEGFTTYLEALYVERIYGKEDMIRYLMSQRRMILNDAPLQGVRDVNFSPTSDIYFRGTWVLHTMRNVVNNDDLWFKLLRGYYDKYKYTTSDISDFEKYVAKKAPYNFKKFFDQYLRNVGRPKLLYRLEEKGDDLKVEFKWEAAVEGFDMPVLMGEKNRYIQVKPNTKKWKSTTISNIKKEKFKIPIELFYIDIKLVKD